MITFISLPGDGGNEELAQQRHDLQRAYSARDLLRRHRWDSTTTAAPTSHNHHLHSDVFVASGFVMREGFSPNLLSFDTFLAAVTSIVSCAENGPCRTAARRRLHILNHKFDLYRILNTEVEHQLVMENGVRWTQTPRVSLAIRVERCMTRYDLVNTMEKYIREKTDPVLTDMWAQSGLSAITAESLGIVLETPHDDSQGSLDAFGLVRLRRPDSARNILKHSLQYSHPMLQELTKRALRQCMPAQAVEYSLILTGRGAEEWASVIDLAHSLIQENLALGRTHTDISFSIRIGVSKVPAEVESFEHVLLNIFEIVWHPKDEKSKLVIERVRAFTVFVAVADASIELRAPASYRSGDDVAVIAVMYYIWANVQLLNAYTQSYRQFRFSCGVSTDVWVLGVAYALCDVLLNAVPFTSPQHPVLLYLAYLHNIGVTLNIKGMQGGAQHALQVFHNLGVPCTLASEDPLQRYNHIDALLEEYSAARRSGSLSSIDMYEMCYRSLSIGNHTLTKEHNELYSKMLSGRNYFRDLCLSHEHLIVRGNGVYDFVTRKITKNIDTRVQFGRITIYGGTLGSRTVHASGEAAAMLAEALSLRRKYVPSNYGSSLQGMFPLRCDSGVWTCLPLSQPFLAEYISDITRLREIIEYPPLQHLASRRLNVLLGKYELHVALNHTQEVINESHHDHRDLYHTNKVDTHCHLAAGMTAKELLNFMKDKFTNHGDDVVGENMQTLAQVQEKLKLTDVESLTVDSLDVQADSSIWDRFDTFNSKYNPLGFSALREIFMKTDNAIKGRYFAELMRAVFRKTTTDGYTFTEFRVSIYGRNKTEWSKLANWFFTHGMASKSNRFLVQIPRIYHVYRKAKELARFSDLIDNIFVPLWEVSMDPSKDPVLHNFLQHVSGFDSVDNEAALDYSMGESATAVGILPSEWASEKNPPYWYWMFYLWANIRSLNVFRKAKGLTTFSFRPHCGESGNPSHLVDGFLVTNGINHGVNLRYSAPLQYLFYLAQIPLAVSPLSNNSMFLKYMENPFPYFFKRGMNVSLSTDDPLQFHHTSEPLIEEYSIASKIWRLSSTDLCEIARASVLMSGFSSARKAEWLGKKYYLHSSEGNIPEKSHVPNIRVAFRFETYHDECGYLDKLQRSGTPMPRAMHTLEEEATLMAEI
eukprot:PhF_6_TR9165/c0_g1_i1/m.14251/K01490/AMPD; AMP deaminase